MLRQESWMLENFFAKMTISGKVHLQSLVCETPKSTEETLVQENTVFFVFFLWVSEERPNTTEGSKFLAMLPICLTGKE